MWSAAKRLRMYNENKKLIIIHLGDHDPSGKDMSRDIVERLNIFDVYPDFKRIALNMDQIEEYNPPPNPTKLTDSRCQAYMQEFGGECWELDALKPEVIDALIRSTVAKYCDLKLFEKVRAKEDKAKELLRKVSENWSKIEKTYSK
jgi:hypothetical protein